MKVGIPLRRWDGWDSISQNFTNIDKYKIDNGYDEQLDTAFGHRIFIYYVIKKYLKNRFELRSECFMGLLADLISHNHT